MIHVEITRISLLDSLRERKLIEVILDSGLPHPILFSKEDGDGNKWGFINIRTGIRPIWLSLKFGKIDVPVMAKDPKKIRLGRTYNGVLKKHSDGEYGFELHNTKRYTVPFSINKAALPAAVKTSIGGELSRFLDYDPRYDPNKHLGEVSSRAFHPEGIVFGKGISAELTAKRYHIYSTAVIQCHGNYINMIRRWKESRQK